MELKLLNKINEQESNLKITNCLPQWCPPTSECMPEYVCGPDDWCPPQKECHPDCCPSEPCPTDEQYTIYDECFIV